jgi:hypothetical protein
MKNYVFMRLLLVWKLISCVTVNIQFVSFYDDDEKSKKNFKKSKIMVDMLLYNKY